MVAKSIVEAASKSHLSIDERGGEQFTVNLADEADDAPNPQPPTTPNNSTCEADYDEQQKS